jgi:hypothetical protein
MVFLLGRYTCPQATKADAVKHHQVSNHVGLLFNEPPGSAELPLV